MNTCDEHDEAVIVFKWKCPACELEKEKSDLENELDAARDRVSDLEHEIEVMNE